MTGQDLASPVERLRAAIAKLPFYTWVDTLGNERKWVALYDVLALPEWAGLEAPGPKCVDCGASLNVGEASVFTVCDTCWAKSYPGAQQDLDSRGHGVAQPPAEDDRAHLLASLEVAQQKIAAGAGLLREVTAQLAAKEAKS